MPPAFPSHVSHKLSASRERGWGSMSPWPQPHLHSRSSPLSHQTTSNYLLSTLTPPSQRGSEWKLGPEIKKQEPSSFLREMICLIGSCLVSQSMEGQPGPCVDGHYTLLKCCGWPPPSQWQLTPPEHSLGPGIVPVLLHIPSHSVNTSLSVGGATICVIF